MTRLHFRYLLIPAIAVLSGSLPAKVIFNWKPDSEHISGKSLKTGTGLKSFPFAVHPAVRFFDPVVAAAADQRIHTHEGKLVTD